MGRNSTAAPPSEKGESNMGERLVIAVASFTSMSASAYIPGVLDLEFSRPEKDVAGEPESVTVWFWVCEGCGRKYPVKDKEKAAPPAVCSMNQGAHGCGTSDFKLVAKKYRVEPEPDDG